MVLGEYAKSSERVLYKKITLDEFKARQDDFLKKVHKVEIHPDFLVNDTFLNVMTVLVGALLIYATVMWIIFLNGTSFHNVIMYTLVGTQHFVRGEIFWLIVFQCCEIISGWWFVFLFIMLLPICVGLGLGALLNGVFDLEGKKMTDENARLLESALAKMKVTTEEELQTFFTDIGAKIEMAQIGWLDSAQGIIRDDDKEGKEILQNMKDKRIADLKEKYGIDVHPRWSRCEGGFENAGHICEFLDRDGKEMDVFVSPEKLVLLHAIYSDKELDNKQVKELAHFLFGGSSGRIRREV